MSIFHIIYTFFEINIFNCMLYAVLLLFFTKKVNNLLKLLIIKLFVTKLNVYRNANMNKF